MVLSFSKRSLTIVALILLLSAGFTVWWTQPERSLVRAWNGLINAVESRHASSIRGWLAPDYSDRWGYDRESITADARLAFFHFRDLDLLVQNVTTSREGNRATITAIIRLKATGSERAGDARLSVNSLYTPFTFEWERDAGFPWSWKLKSFDHPQLDLNRFRRGSFLPY
jgi:hypothetical protein